jgi:HK97 gp10 family phage protein
MGKKNLRKSWRQAAKAVGTMWTDELKARVPVDTADLRDSIGQKVSTKKRGKNTSVKVSVGPTWDLVPRNPGDASQQPAVYARFTEFGTKTQPAKPWMRPVFDSTKNEAVELFANTLRELFNDEIKG